MQNMQETQAPTLRTTSISVCPLRGLGRFTTHAFPTGKTELCFGRAQSSELKQGTGLETRSMNATHAVLRSVGAF